MKKYMIVTPNGVANAALRKVVEKYLADNKTPTATAIDRATHAALSSNIVALRAKYTLSQAMLAERSGVSRAIISVLEQSRGNVTLDVLSKISAALYTTPAQLLTDRVSDDTLSTRYSKAGRPTTIET